MQFECPNPECRTRYRVRVQVGQQVRCARCGHIWRVQEADFVSDTPEEDQTSNAVAAEEAESMAEEQSAADDAPAQEITDAMQPDDHPEEESFEVNDTADDRQVSDETEIACAEADDTGELAEGMAAEDRIESEEAQEEIAAGSVESEGTPQILERSTLEQIIQTIEAESSRQRQYDESAPEVAQTELTARFDPDEIASAELTGDARWESEAQQQDDKEIVASDAFAQEAAEEETGEDAEDKSPDMELRSALKQGAEYQPEDEDPAAEEARDVQDEADDQAEEPVQYGNGLAAKAKLNGTSAPATDHQNGAAEIIETDSAFADEARADDDFDVEPDDLRSLDQILRGSSAGDTAEGDEPRAESDEPYDGETGEDLAPVPPEATAQKTSGKVSGLAVAAAWGLFLTVLAGAGVSAVSFREQIVASLPQAAQVYDAIGMPVNDRVLAFDEVAYSWGDAETRSRLRLSGQIVNRGDKVRDVPPLRVVLRDHEGKQLLATLRDTQIQPLAAGEQARFEIELEAPSAISNVIEIEFDHEDGDRSADGTRQEARTGG